MRKLAAIIVLLALVALACSTTPVPPTADVSTIVAGTLAAYTVETALTQASPAATVTGPPQVTAKPEEVAPNPLPAANTGISLDSGQVNVPGARCDLLLTQSGLFHQVNGSKLSGNNVSYSPPTRSKCVAGVYAAGDLAIQTDLHMCFISNQSRTGFVLARQYLGSAPLTGIVFDYWVFR